MVKNLPSVWELQETWVQFLGQEDPLEEGMATHFSKLAWRIPWTKEAEEGDRRKKRKSSQIHNCQNLEVAKKCFSG